MNIFVVHNNPKISARMLCSEHTSKMQLESAQMLCTIYHLQGIKAQYKPTHANHRCTVWARQSKENFNWLIDHALEMSEDHKRRQGNKDYHKSRAVTLWCRDNQDKLVFPSVGLTQFAVAIKPEHSFCIVDGDPIQSYRNFYIYVKSKFATWKNCNPPEWYLKRSE